MKLEQLKHQLLEPCDYDGANWNWGKKFFTFVAGTTECMCCVSMRHLAIGLVVGFLVGLLL